MAWELSDNVRGPKGDKGPAGTISSVSVAALPPGSPPEAVLSGTEDVHVDFRIPVGERGAQGPAGTISSASAETIPAGEQAEVIMSGTAEVKHAKFRIPRGLPGVNAVPSVEAVAQYIDAPDTLARAAINRAVASQMVIVQEDELSEFVEAQRQAIIASGPMIDLRLYGAKPGSTSDLAVAINAAVAANGDGPYSLMLPASALGAAYTMASDAIIDRPDVSVVGFNSRVQFTNSAKFVVGDAPVANAAPRNYYSAITGLNMFRPATNGGADIPGGSGFVRLRAVRAFSVLDNRMTGAHSAVYVDPADNFSIMKDGGSHVIGMIDVFGNRVAEVEFFARVQLHAANSWMTASDWKFMGNTVNRFYTTCYFFDGVDGVTFDTTEKVFSLDFLSSNPRRASLKHVLHVGTRGSDWVTIGAAHWFGSGLEGILVESGKLLHVDGLIMPRTGMLEPRDAIKFTAMAGAFAEILVVGADLKWYTKSGVKVIGNMAKVVLGPNLTDFNMTPESYVGSTALSTIPHYRYDVSEVGALKSAQMQITGTLTGKTGEGDKLPGHDYATAAELMATFNGRSGAVRSVNVPSNGLNIFPLTDILDAPQNYAGFVIVVVKQTFASSSKSRAYLLSVSPSGVAVVSSTGPSGGADDGVFNFSLDNGFIRATPVAPTTGTWVFSAQALGNLIAG